MEASYSDACVRACLHRGVATHSHTQASSVYVGYGQYPCSFAVKLTELQVPARTVTRMMCGPRNSMKVCSPEPGEGQGTPSAATGALHGSSHVAYTQQCTSTYPARWTKRHREPSSTARTTSPVLEGGNHSKRARGNRPRGAQAGRPEHHSGGGWQSTGARANARRPQHRARPRIGPGRP